MSAHAVVIISTALLVTNAFADPEAAPRTSVRATPWFFTRCACPIERPSLDKSAVLRVIRTHRAQVRECYVHEAQYGNPNLAGEAVLHFTIDAAGTVTSARVDGSLADPAVFRCLVNQMQAWQFHEGEGIVEVNYPITFRMPG